MSAPLANSWRAVPLILRADFVGRGIGEPAERRLDRVALYGASVGGIRLRASPESALRSPAAARPARARETRPRKKEPRPEGRGGLGYTTARMLRSAQLSRERTR